VFFAVSNPIAAMIVSKYGAKKCMIAASMFYSLFILLILSQSNILIFIGSSLLGFAAALLWTGQNTYLVRASDRKFYGRNSGIFSSLVALGSAAGVFAIGALISAYHYNLPFLLFSLFPIIGLVMLYRITDIWPKQKANPFRILKKSLASKTALRLSSIWVVLSFVSGLMFGVIPLQIKNVLGIYYIGIRMALFYILPMFTSYFFGRLSDIKGRKNMILFSYILLMIGLITLYLSSEAIFLVLGIFLLAVNSAIIGPVTMALVGDVFNEKNLEFLTALFGMVQKIGVIGALLLSKIYAQNAAALYEISTIFVVISLAIILPLFRLETSKIRAKLCREVN
jgi:MFS family permease